MKGPRIMMVTVMVTGVTMLTGTSHAEESLIPRGDGLCRAWAIDPKNSELLELRSLFEKSMKRP